MKKVFSILGTLFLTTALTSAMEKEHEELAQVATPSQTQTPVQSSEPSTSSDQHSSQSQIPTVLIDPAQAAETHQAFQTLQHFLDIAVGELSSFEKEVDSFLPKLLETEQTLIKDVHMLMSAGLNDLSSIYNQTLPLIESSEGLVTNTLALVRQIEDWSSTLKSSPAAKLYAGHAAAQVKLDHAHLYGKGHAGSAYAYLGETNAAQISAKFSATPVNPSLKDDALHAPTNTNLQVTVSGLSAGPETVFNGLLSDFVKDHPKVWNIFTENQLFLSIGGMEKLIEEKTGRVVHELFGQKGLLHTFTLPHRVNISR